MHFKHLPAKIALNWYRAESFQVSFPVSSVLCYILQLLFLSACHAKALHGAPGVDVRCFPFQKIHISKPIKKKNMVSEHEKTPLSHACYRESGIPRLQFLDPFLATHTAEFRHFTNMIDAFDWHVSKKHV